MERLTDKTQLKYGTENCLSTEYVSRPICTDAGDEIVFGPAIDRLAAYEDTGLTPEDIEGILERGTPLEGWTKELMKKYLSIGSVDHLMELVHAEKAGRLVVLPESDRELTDEESAEMTGYKCPICAHHSLCTTPGMRPMCWETYDHFEPRRPQEALRKEEAEHGD